MVKAVGEVGAKIVKLKDEQGKTWAEISDTVGLPVGKAMFEYEKAMVTPKNKISGRSDDELAKNIAKARNEGLSWGRIAARSGKTEGFCRKAFEDVTGDEARGNRIGKGGRYPSEVEPPAKAEKVKGAAKKASKAVKKAAKKAPAKKASKATKKVAKKTPIKKAVAHA